MRKKLAVGILVITLGAFTTVVGIFYWLGPEFEWGVNVGDEFLCEVRVFDTLQAYGETSAQMPFLNYNNTDIVVAIFSLPEVTYIADADALIDIIEHSKIEMRFPNGSDAAPRFAGGYRMPEAISNSILPIGGWNRLDAFFPDEPEDIYYGSGFFSKKLQDSVHFQIGYRSYNVDVGGGWSALVSLANGLPQSVTFWREVVYGDDQFSYQVEITFVSQL